MNKRLLFLTVIMMVLAVSVVSATWTDYLRSYRFEGTTRYLYDSGSHNVTSYLNNATRTNDGYLGKGLNFTDIHSFISLAVGENGDANSDIQFVGANPFSVSFAYRIDTKPNTNPVLILQFWGEGGSFGQNQLFLTQQINGTLSVSGGEYSVGGTPNLNTSEWNVIVYTREASGWQIYVNGVNAGSGTYTGGTTSVNNRISFGYIGNDPVFSATADELKIWDRHLSASEVADYTANISTETNNTINILFEESFGWNANSGLNPLTESDCSEDSYTTGSMQGATPTPSYATQYVMPNNALNQWFCYVENATNDVNDWDKATTSKETGYDMSSSGTTLFHVPEYESIATFLDLTEQVDTANTDGIEFTCDASSLNSANSLYLGLTNKNSLSQGAFISLVNGGCTDITGTPYTDCCELTDVVGYDCSTGKTNVKTTIGDFVSSCSALGELNFQDLTRFELWQTKNDSASSIWYFDDMRIYRSFDYTTNNTLPFIIYVNGVPNPANITEEVNYGVSIGDAEDNSSSIYSAFDCNSNGTLDYSWGLRGVAPTYNCTYTSAGNYTATLWASDIAHYPSSNTSGTDTVEVYLMTSETFPNATSCTGFISPSCATSNIFCDDFNYNYSLSCNGWEGGAKDVVPTDNKARFNGLGVNYDTIKYTFDPIISSEQYNDFTVEFDMIVNTSDSYTFYLYDSSTGQFSLYGNINNYNLYVLDNTAPYSNYITTLNQSQEISYKAFVNFVTGEIAHYIDGNLITITEFYDIGVTKASTFTLAWASISQDIAIDNFVVNEGNENPEFSGNLTTEVSYTYDGDFFCAINWTDPENAHFSEQNCIDRGYNTGGNLIGLCLPRACLSDSASWVFQTAMNNILITIVIVFVIILFAPLVIAGRRR